MIACIDSRAISHKFLVTSELNTAGDVDEIQLSEALAKLHNFSLPKVTNDDSTGGKSYTVHSLVHSAIRDFLTPEEKSVALEKTASKLTRILPSAGFENWPTWRVYLPHATTFLQTAGENLNTIDIATICHAMANYFTAINRRQDAHFLAQRAATALEILLGERHKDTLSSIMLVTMQFQSLSRWEEAEIFLTKILSLHNETLGEENYETAFLTYLLSHSLRKPGRLDEAEKIRTKALEMFEAQRRQNDHDTWSGMYHLARIFLEDGRLKEAEELFMMELEALTNYME